MYTVFYKTLNINNFGAKTTAQIDQLVTNKQPSYFKTFKPFTDKSFSITIYFYYRLAFARDFAHADVVITMHSNKQSRL